MKFKCARKQNIKKKLIVVKMDFAGFSLCGGGSSNDPQTAINTLAIDNLDGRVGVLTQFVQEDKEAIALNTDQISDLLRAQRVIASCSTNPSTSGEVTQSQLLLKSGPRPLLVQGLGENTQGLLNSRYITHPDLSFGMGLSGTPNEIRYRVSTANRVKLKVNLQLNVVFPAHVVVYQVKIYLGLKLYYANVLQQMNFYLDNRFVTIGPGGGTYTVSFIDYILISPTLQGVDELRIAPEMDSTFGPGPLPSSVDIVQDWSRPVGNFFSVEVL